MGPAPIVDSTVAATWSTTATGRWASTVASGAVACWRRVVSLASAVIARHVGDLHGGGDAVGVAGVVDEGVEQLGHAPRSGGRWCRPAPRPGAGRRRSRPRRCGWSRRRTASPGRVAGEDQSLKTRFLEVARGAGVGVDVGADLLELVQAGQRVGVGVADDLRLGGQVGPKVSMAASVPSHACW